MEYSFLSARLSFTFDVHMCVFLLANKLCCLSTGELLNTLMMFMLRDVRLLHLNKDYRLSWTAFFGAKACLRLHNWSWHIGIYYEAILHSGDADNVLFLVACVHCVQRKTPAYIFLPNS